MTLTPTESRALATIDGLAALGVHATFAEIGRDPGHRETIGI